jgi:predicted ATPase
MPKSNLERIIVSGFKSIYQLDLTLKNLNVLIGANGSGKSNFISVFKFLNQVINKELQFFVARSGGVDTILHFGRKITSNLYLYFEFGSERENLFNAYECNLIPTVK